MKQRLKNMAYDCVNVITRGKGIRKKINGLNIRFAPKWSRFYNNGYEKDSFDFFRAKTTSGDVVLDIGAHIGLYSVLFSQLAGDAGRVFAFEPTPATFSILSQTLALNKTANVQAINKAVALSSGKVYFNLHSDNGEANNANSLVNSAGVRQSVEITAVSVDDFRAELGKRINVMKIDVEGAELQLLKGACNTFKNDRPFAILALHPMAILQNGDSLNQVWECLAEYNMRVLQQGREVTREDFCSRTLLFDVELIPA